MTVISIAIVTRIVIKQYDGHPFTRAFVKTPQSSNQQF
jgi:hypothetical protein